MVLDEKAESVIRHVREVLGNYDYEYKNDIIMWEKEIDRTRPVWRLLEGPLFPERVKFTLFYYEDEPFLLRVEFEDLTREQFPSHPNDGLRRSLLISRANNSGFEPPTHSPRNYPPSNSSPYQPPALPSAPDTHPQADPGDHAGERETRQEQQSQSLLDNVSLRPESTLSPPRFPTSPRLAPLHPSIVAPESILFPSALVRTPPVDVVHQDHQFPFVPWPETSTHSLTHSNPQSRPGGVRFHQGPESPPSPPSGRLSPPVSRLYAAAVAAVAATSELNLLRFAPRDTSTPQPDTSGRLSRQSAEMSSSRSSTPRSPQESPPQLSPRERSAQRSPRDRLAQRSPRDRHAPVRSPGERTLERSRSRVLNRATRSNQNASRVRVHTPVAPVQASTSGVRILPPANPALANTSGARVIYPASRGPGLRILRPVYTAGPNNVGLRLVTPASTTGIPTDPSPHAPTASRLVLRSSHSRLARGSASRVVLRSSSSRSSIGASSSSSNASTPRSAVQPSVSSTSLGASTSGSSLGASASRSILRPQLSNSSQASSSSLSATTTNAVIEPGLVEVENMRHVNPRSPAGPPPPRRLTPALRSRRTLPGPRTPRFPPEPRISRSYSGPATRYSHQRPPSPSSAPGSRTRRANSPRTPRTHLRHRNSRSPQGTSASTPASPLRASPLRVSRSPRQRRALEAPVVSSTNEPVPTQRVSPTTESSSD